MSCDCLLLPSPADAPPPPPPPDAGVARPWLTVPVPPAPVPATAAGRAPAQVVATRSVGPGRAGARLASPEARHERAVLLLLLGGAPAGAPVALLAGPHLAVAVSGAPISAAAAGGAPADVVAADPVGPGRAGAWLTGDQAPDAGARVLLHRDQLAMSGQRN